MRWRKHSGQLCEKFGAAASGKRGEKSLRNTAEHGTATLTEG